MVIDPKKELTSRAGELLRTRVVRCLEPTELCKKNSIRAHSIQNKRILSQMVSRGHVVMIKLSPDLSQSRAVIDYKYVGRNMATTFTGLCSKHDNSIFRAIDRTEVDFTNQEHLFLLCYRAVLREFHATLRAGLLNQGLYSEKVELGLTRGDIPTNDGLLATWFVSNSYEFYLYKRLFDELLLSRMFDQVQHRLIVLKNVEPTIAVSSVVGYSSAAINKEDNERIILNVFPEGRDMCILFSCHSKDASYVDFHISDILTSEGDLQKYRISKYVLACCENLVIHPTYFEKWPDEKKDIVKWFYAKTITQDLDDYENELLYLF
jgi:hypothetical protein